MPDAWIRHLAAHTSNADISGRQLLEIVTIGKDCKVDGMI